MSTFIEAQVTAPLATIAYLDITPLSTDIQPLSTDINDIYASLLASKHKASTRKTYQGNLNQFAQFLTTKEIKKGDRNSISVGASSGILHQFLALSKKEAICLVGEYQAALLNAGYLPNSINVKLSSIKAFVNYAFQFEACLFKLEGVKALSPDTYRNTKGTTVANMGEILAAPSSSTLKGLRDATMLRLLWDCALRRSELVNLNWGDMDMENQSLKILGKGRVSKEAIALSPKAINLLMELKEAFGAVTNSTPIFISLDHRYQGDSKRISTKAVEKIVKAYSSGIEGGKIISPHKIRHTAITAVLDSTNGNVRAAQALSRHKNLETLVKYDDNRVDEQRKSVNLLANLI